MVLHVGLSLLSVDLYWLRVLPPRILPLPSFVQKFMPHIIGLRVHKTYTWLRSLDLLRVAGPATGVTGSNPFES